MRREALFRRRVKPETKHPLVQRDMRAPQNRADAHREFEAASVAPVPARPHRFAAEWRNSVDLAACRACRPMRPADFLEHRPRRVVIVVAGIIKVRRKDGHRLSP